MTWIKICGITNLEDALTAVNAGADALGFVFYEKSPRKIDPDMAREIVAKLPPEVEKVGVFVDESSEQIGEIAKHARLTAMQLPRGVSMGMMGPPLSSPSCLKTYVVLPAAQLFDEGGFQWLAPATRSKAISAIFLDSATLRQPGGTGKVFDWERAAPLVAAIGGAFDVVVAGGLTPTNVTGAIRILKPWGVDVTSGVEVRPGKKDPEKVRAFVAAVRQTEKNA
jgi:phosphoribosylanthranilate isomerase